MALNAYMTVEGNSHGQIRGSVTQKGREGWIALYAFHHEIVSPRDAASGLPTGKRQHKPVTATKEVDKSTVPLLQALVDNEQLSDVVIRFYAPSRAGKEDLIYTIKLKNAAISDITQDMLNNKVVENMKMPVLEMISFTYQKIEWIWEDGALTGQDDWQIRGK